MHEEIGHNRRRLTNDLPKHDLKLNESRTHDLHYQQRCNNATTPPPTLSRPRPSFSNTRMDETGANSIPWQPYRLLQFWDSQAVTQLKEEKKKLHMHTQEARGPTSNLTHLHLQITFMMMMMTTKPHFHQQKKILRTTPRKQKKHKQQKKKMISLVSTTQNLRQSEWSPKYCN